MAFLAGLVVGALGSGCEPDLPPCDETVAYQVVFLDAPSDVSSDDGVPMYSGQALMHQSCGGASYCHASRARGVFREGVPKGLDFDVGPACVGRACLAGEDDLERLAMRSAHVRAHARQLYGRVLDGSMPPGAVGARVRARAGIFRTLAAGATSLASGEPVAGLDTAEGRRVFGTWLACGAPVVQTVREPDATHAPGSSCEGGTTNADAASAIGACITRLPATPAPIAVCPGTSVPAWSSIHADLIDALCASSCHGPRSPRTKVLAFGDRDASYTTLLDQSVDEPLVVPGDPDDSHLVHHLEGLYGTAIMPPQLFSARLPHEVLESVRAWITAGAPRECP